MKSKSLYDLIRESCNSVTDFRRVLEYANDIDNDDIEYIMLSDSIRSYFSPIGYETVSKQKSVLERLLTIKSNLMKHYFSGESPEMLFITICYNHIRHGDSLTEELVKSLNELHKKTL